jgi:hypothetical protein
MRRLGYASALRKAEAMVDSGTCAICGKPVEPAEAEMDTQTGSMVHAACLEQEGQVEEHAE